MPGEAGLELAEFEAVRRRTPMLAGQEWRGPQLGLVGERFRPPVPAARRRVRAVAERALVRAGRVARPAA
jgi:hypothetical protein